jgi:nickel-type superoxide dismutase maturation protease
MARDQRYHALRKAFPTVVAGAALLWWRLRPFRVAVRGASMEPTLRAGEFLIAVRARRIERGTMVVMEHPERPGFEMVKRVAALPGERVGDRVLQGDQYWVIGDRPDASTDSRSFGPIHRSAIAGVIRLRYWPLSRLGVVS